IGLAWHPDGAELAAGFTDGTVRVLGAETGRARLVLEADPRVVRAVAFRPDGGQLAAVGDDRVIRLWRLPGGELERTIESGHSAWIIDMAYVVDGAVLVTQSFREVRTWDVESGELLHTMAPESAAQRMAITPDGARVAVADNRGAVRLFDLATGDETRAVVLDPTVNQGGMSARTGQAWTIGAMIFDGEGRMIMACQGDVSTRDLQRGEPVGRYQGHEGNVGSLALSPDGTRLFSSGFEPIVRVWDVATGEQVLALRDVGPRVRKVALSPDGTRLAGVSDDLFLRIWDGRTPADRSP
ncbi:MAG: WD40 repeat domain-containing protein, partial [Planctomycetota bacterium]